MIQQINKSIKQEEKIKVIILHQNYMLQFNKNLFLPVK